MGQKATREEGTRLPGRPRARDAGNRWRLESRSPDDSARRSSRAGGDGQARSGCRHTQLLGRRLSVRNCLCPALLLSSVVRNAILQRGTGPTAQDHSDRTRSQVVAPTVLQRRLVLTDDCLHQPHDDEVGPTNGLKGVDLHGRPAGGRDQPRSEIGLLPLPGRELTARRGHLAGEDFREITVLPLQKLDDTTPGALEDVTQAVHDQVSDQARYVTGIQLPVDGGAGIK